jgi:phage tail-like protein
MTVDGGAGRPTVVSAIADGAVARTGRRHIDVGRSRNRAPRDPQWLINQMPVGMLESDFFVRFLSLFQEVATTLLDGADNVENIVDPTIAPDAMLRWMASWIGVDSVDRSLPDELQRLIVRSSSETMSWRGTKAGLTRFLEMTSGGAAEVVDGGGVWREGEAPSDTATVRMTVASTGWLGEADFIALLRDEVPAHVRAELYIGDRLAWATATPSDLGVGG